MSDVRVIVNDATVISALNTPGGAVFEWRNETEAAVLAQAFMTSPINDPANTRHDTKGFRPPVGTYKASWVTRRQGNGHRVGFAIENFADHAIFVEEGRGPSTGWERFSWAKGSPPGAIRVAKHGTRGWNAQHILRNAVNAVMPGATGGAYAPLP